MTSWKNRSDKPRPIVIDGDVARIALTRGFCALIDAADVPLVEDWQWTASIANRTTYAYRNAWDPIEKRQKRLSLHRFLMQPPPDMVIDHLNGDGLDNRRANMRVCTTKENHANRFYHRDPTSERSGTYAKSGHFGIWATSNNYCARFMVGGKQVDIARGQDPAPLAVIRAWCVSIRSAPAPTEAAERVALVRIICEREDIAAGAAMALVRHVIS